MAKVSSWQFTVSTPEGTSTIEVTIKRDREIFDVLERLSAPERVWGHLRHHGLGTVRRFHWRERLTSVTGIRLA